MSMLHLCICLPFSYEIQLEEKVQRKGLGRFLMQLMELMAFK